VEKSDAENPLADLACDILGGLLRSRDDSPHFVIYDYFTRHGITDFESTDPKELFWHFSVLLRGFIKKELSNLPGDRDPQVDLLKRRFKDILREAEYSNFTGADDSTKFAHLAANGNNLRYNKSPIPPDELERLVMNAFADSGSRREWCRRIFKLLDRIPEYQNFVRLSDLLTAVIKVNSEHLELYYGRPTYRPYPEDGITDDMLTQARDQAVEYIKNHSLSRFLKQNRLTADEVDKYADAARHFLTDLSHTGSPDPIPGYFRLVMPADTHRLYLKRHKYCFETAINEALEEFRRILNE
jgi:hypothetical protein